MFQLEKKSPGIKSSGYVLPWNIEANQPAFIEIEGVIFIPLFVSKYKLDVFLKSITYDYEVSVKVINDMDDFMDSVKDHYRVALSPYLTEYGTTRFTEIKSTKT